MASLTERVLRRIFWRALNEETRHLIHEAYIVHAMPERMRQVVTLCKVYDWSAIQIAARLQLPVATVEALMVAGARRFARYQPKPRQAGGHRYIPHPLV